jgi:hypothetical protein
MLNRVTLPVLLGLSVAAAGLVACGDSSSDTGNAEDTTSTSGDGDGDNTAGDGDGTPGDGDGTPGDGDGMPGDGDGTPGDGDGTPGDGDGTPGDGDGMPGDGDGAPGCMVWEITYDLTGSTFEISDTPMGAGNQVNTVEEPYDAPDTVGPGNFVVRFNDVNGSPGGSAFMYSYQMSMHFSVGSPNLAQVATDLENDAGPEDCGITSAEISGTTVDWNPSAIVGHHSVGMIECNGFACGFAGFMSGVPVPVDEVTDHPLNPFLFSNDFSSFDMAAVVVQMDMNSTTEWTFVGTETSRELVAAPDCLCQ